MLQFTVFAPGRGRLLKQVTPDADGRDVSTKDFRQHGLFEPGNRRGTRKNVADLRDSSVSLLPEGLPPIRVLIGDDSAVLRSELTRMLQSSLQMRVCGSACNGEEVVEKARLLHPDVITLDVEMPMICGVSWGIRRKLRCGGALFPEAGRFLDLYRSCACLSCASYLARASSVCSGSSRSLRTPAGAEMWNAVSVPSAKTWPRKTFLPASNAYSGTAVTRLSGA